MPRNKIFKKGFTLIELLVVIAIIGILSSVVIAALNTARSNATFKASTALSAHLDRTLGSQAEGWWNFDDCTGSSAKDISGSNKNATLTGTGASFSSVNNAFRSGCSLSLTGGTQNVWMPQPLVSGSPFTIALWYYPTRVNVSCDMLYSGSDNNDLQLFFGNCAGSNLRTSIENTEVQTSFALSSSNINQWHFIVWAYNYQTNRVWVDNQMVLGNAQSTALTINDTTVSIGNANGSSGSYPIAGQIDEFRIFSTALTAEEAGKLYAEGLEAHSLAKK